MAFKWPLASLMSNQCATISSAYRISYCWAFITISWRCSSTTLMCWTRIPQKLLPSYWMLRLLEFLMIALYYKLTQKEKDWLSIAWIEHAKLTSRRLERCYRRTGASKEKQKFVQARSVAWHLIIESDALTTKVKESMGDPTKSVFVENELLLNANNFDAMLSGTLAQLSTANNISRMRLVLAWNSH